MVNCAVIQEQIDKLVQYLQPLLPLANFHMVDYFTRNGYRNYIPEDIQLEISKLQKHQVVVDKIFNNDYEHVPKLLEYAKASERFTLKNCSDVCLTASQFQDKLRVLGSEQFSSQLKLEMFMTAKKSHEVEVLSCLALAVHKLSGTSHVVDIGDGKGYLSSMLAMHHKIPVLGVDASKANTNGAVERVQKLSKVWNSVVNKTAEKTRETSAGLYKQVTQFVHQDTDFAALVQTVFLEKPTGLSLVGLHTCGNLASTSIRIFSSSEHIRTICNVGCCYHHLNELFETDPKRLEHPLIDHGFPLSDYLKTKRFVIGRAARMIAAQSVERILNSKTIPSTTLFYRALFEVLLENKQAEVPSDKRQVGRFRKECTSFVDYVRKASARISVQVTDEEAEELFQAYKHRVQELNSFYLIRCMLAPIVESLILLDRLLFLHEQGYDNSFLVQLFDPVVSPRCYGLIAIK